jgi:hypothetical protein
MICQGLSGTFELQPDRITIHRGGSRAYRYFGEETPDRYISTAAIREFRFKNARYSSDGWLRLVLGADQVPDSYKASPDDPDAMLFTSGQNDAWNNLREQLLQIIGSNRKRGVDAATIEYEKGSSVAQPHGAKAEREAKRRHADTARIAERGERAQARVRELAAERKAKEARKNALLAAANAMRSVLDRKSREELVIAATDQRAHNAADREAKLVNPKTLADQRSGTTLVGSQLKRAALKVLADHSAPGELPWFILNSAGRGLLAAFEDRLIIAKVGALTSIMAGSMGGGRVTTFPYAEITNIEFNSGLINGVLEILTPSYQGSGNHDYWRSMMKGTNSAGDSPWTLSNCLPMENWLHTEALPMLNKLERTIMESKRPRIVLPPAQPAQRNPTSGLVDDLKQLAELHTQGVLDDAEFADAKQATIALHRQD